MPLLVIGEPDIAIELPSILAATLVTVPLPPPDEGRSAYATFLFTSLASS